MSASNRLLAVLNIAMADTAFTIWSAKRFYGALSGRSDVAAGDCHTACGDRRQCRTRSRSGLAAARQHAVASRIPRRAPQPQWRGRNRAAQPLRRRADVYADDELGGVELPNRTYTSISQARSDGNNARVWGGMHYPSTVAISDAVGEAIARLCQPERHAAVAGHR